MCGYFCDLHFLPSDQVAPLGKGVLRILALSSYEHPKVLHVEVRWSVGCPQGQSQPSLAFKPGFIVCYLCSSEDKSRSELKCCTCCRAGRASAAGSNMQMQASCPRKLLSGFFSLRVGDRYQIFHHFPSPVVDLKRYHSLLWGVYCTPY